MQTSQSTTRQLLTAREVQDVLHIDRSTVYRMAEDGRLPSIRVGKQWRFPAERILAMLDDDLDRAESANTPPVTSPVPVTAAAGIDPALAQSAIEIAADLLDVMMVVTDMDGQPITEVTNPCPWFTAHRDEPGVMDACLAEWRDLADLHDLQPRFQIGPAGFECARALVRSHQQLVGMVLAGGISPPGLRAADDGLFDLGPDARERVLTILPKIAASLSPRTEKPARSEGARPKETR